MAPIAIRKFYQICSIYLVPVCINIFPLQKFPPETSNIPKHFGYISSFPSDCKKDKIIYHRGPKVNDFNFQCNEGDIIREILDAQVIDLKISLY